MVDDQSSWPAAISAVAAAFAVLAALAIPLTAFARRPKLSILEDEDGIHTRLEGANSNVPWIRLIVRNGRGLRAGHGTRVLVESYAENRLGAIPVALGSPVLGWPSTSSDPDGGVVVFPNERRPLDFAALQREKDRPGWGPPERTERGDEWHLRLTLAMHAQGVFISNFREFLEPRANGYTIRLLVGSNDGAARRYGIDINWAGDAVDPRAALASVQLAVRRVG